MPAGRRVPAPGALASTLGVGCLVDAAARRAGYPRAGVPQGQGRGSRARGSEGQQGGTHPAVAPPDRARLLLSPRQFGGAPPSGLFSFECLAQPVRAAGSRCARAPQARAPASCSVRRARLGGGAVLFWWWRAKGVQRVPGDCASGGAAWSPTQRACVRPNHQHTARTSNVGHTRGQLVCGSTQSGGTSSGTSSGSSSGSSSGGGTRCTRERLAGHRGRGTVQRQRAGGFSLAQQGLPCAHAAPAPLHKGHRAHRCQ